MKEHPNVIMIVVDQMRRDALGVNRPDFAHTPHLDQLAREGVNFSRAYSACPSCIAARASLLTGLRHEHHGFTGYDSKPEWRYPVTLPGVLSSAGYQTQCVGKMHVEPARALMGFHNVILHDGFLHDKRRKYSSAIEYDDYLPDIRHTLGPDFDISDTTIGCNGYAVRCWPWEERLHPTSWVTTKSIEFLRRRDPTKPFFLNVSYHRPHSPLDPPPSYFSMYENRTMPDPYKGDWTEFVSNYAGPENPIPVEPYYVDRARRAYCALVSQIDYELNRLFMVLGDLNLWDEALIMLVADHGDMLYDHHLVRKSMPFEGCSGIPLLFRLPRSMRQGRQGVTDTKLAELRDIFPTVCELCGVDIPAGLDGQSLFSDSFQRKDLHGEHTNSTLANQWMTDGHEKYCWFSQSGRELLFDLENDPHELHNIAEANQERVAFWRKRLVEELSGRPEGYVQNNDLRVGCTPRPSLPWAGIGRNGI